MKHSVKTGTCLAMIVILFVLAVYQMVLIVWEMQGGDGSSGQQSAEQESFYANLLRPYALYITLGGEEKGSYAKLSQESEGFETVFEQAYEVLDRLWQEGEDVILISEEALPREREKCIFTYTFQPDTFLIEAQLTASETDLPEKRWEEIWIIPSQSVSQPVEVYFINSQTEQYAKLMEESGWRWEENQQFLDVLLEQGAPLKKEHLATDWAWPNVFERTDYVLEQTQRETAYRVRAESAFLAEGQIDRERMQEYAMQFFEYPETVSIKETEYTMLFINEKMTVKMDASGRLQYVETLTDAEKELLPMQEAYRLAAGFLQQDIERSQTGDIRYVFSGCERVKDSYVFYFNYMIQGIPYRMEPVKTVEWRMAFPIKITVEGKKVRRYERYVIDIEVEKDSAYELQSTWLEAVDLLERKNWKLKEAPRLIYYLSGNRLALQWEAETGEGRAWTMAN